MRLGTILLVSTTLLAGCEVNLNYRGAVGPRGQDLQGDRPARARARHLRRRHRAALVGPQRDRGRRSRSARWSSRCSTRSRSTRSSRATRSSSRSPARRASEHRGVTIGVNISPTARLRVAVPRITNINATSGDGSIRAEAIDGRIVLQHHRRQRHRRRGSAATSRFARATARSASTTPPASSISKPTDGSIGLEAKPTRAARADRRRLDPRRPSSRTR